ncbi:MAG TPA: outer membrane beta-barrel protein [Candidatus Limnocylindria bacterium]|nr:outer membrane beta-barrel protein [Candidatus Limnocylindria bacterium]
MLQRTYPMACVAFTATLAVSPQAAAFDLDSAQQWMVYNIGELRIKPQLELNTEFTDNVYYAGLKPFDYVAHPLLSQGQIGGNTVVFVPVGFTDINGTTVQAGSIYTGPLVNNGGASGIAATNYVVYHQPVSPRNSELISSASPGIKFQYGDEVLNNISLSYAATLSKYLVSGLEPSPQHLIHLLSKFEYSRLRLDVDAGAQFVSSFLGGGQNFGGQQVLIDRWSENSRARLTYQTTTRIDTYGEFQHSLTSYDTPIALYGTAEWSGNAGAEYQFSQDWKLFTEAHYGQTTVEPSTPELPTSPHSIFYGGYVGARGTFSPRITGSVKAGYELREYPSIADSAVGAPAFEFDVNYALGPSTQLGLNYSRKTSASSQVANQSFVYDSVKFTANQGLDGAGFWWALFSAKYIHDEFNSTPGFGSFYVPNGPGGYLLLQQGTVDYGRTDDQIIMSIGVQYVPRPWLRASLTYEYETYTPTFSDSRLQGITLPEYDNHRVILSLNLGY